MTFLCDAGKTVLLIDDETALPLVFESTAEAAEFSEFALETFGPRWPTKDLLTLRDTLRVMRALPRIPCASCRTVHRLYSPEGLCRACSDV